MGAAGTDTESVGNVSNKYPGYGESDQAAPKKKNQFVASENLFVEACEKYMNV